ncbi:DUF2163 domain-containing protein [Roseobacter sp. YSTF-M11]|uniref:DUF2163 domain-containing protein n=1 Tax=Roseobacter insulae TaxID=2859783 RepID=A0A9X1FWI5_9RHOB|nr:DUF2163 domain-containing protein [Roseobacter insulae]MBW4708617.1 DUF2163 domain-containing protein [Roseobacter insulae]
MRDLPSALLTHLSERGAGHARLLVWITAREKATGTAVSIGFWTGADHRVFSIGGEDRTYYGAGSLIRIAPLVSAPGLNVRTTRLTFSPISEEFRVAVGLYDTNDAPLQIHVANFDPLTRAPIAEPVRRFKGFAKGLTSTRAAMGGDARAELAVQSAAHVLTRTLPLKKSDAALQARHPGDLLRQYTDISGSVETAWGEARGSAPAGAAPPSAQPGGWVNPTARPDWGSSR